MLICRSLTKKKANLKESFSFSLEIFSSLKLEAEYLKAIGLK